MRDDVEAWTVTSAIDCGAPRRRERASRRERDEARTLKLTLERDGVEVIALEGAPWRGVGDVEALEGMVEVLVSRAALEGRAREGVVVLRDEDVRAGEGGDGRAAARARRAREASLAGWEEGESETSANAPKFVAFDPTKPVERRARPAAAVAEATRRLAESTLVVGDESASPSSRATAPSAAPRAMTVASVDASKVSASDAPGDVAEAARVVRTKPKLPPGRRATATATATAEDSASAIR